MIYKYIIAFSTLSFALASNINIEARANEQKNILVEHEQELTGLSKKITDKEQYVDLLWGQMEDMYELIIESLENQEKEEFKSEANAFLDDLNDSLAKNLDIKPLIAKAFIKTDKNRIVRLKSLIIRYCVETSLLKNLINSYEECLQKNN